MSKRKKIKSRHSSTKIKKKESIFFKILYGSKISCEDACGSEWKKKKKFAEATMKEKNGNKRTCSQ